MKKLMRRVAVGLALPLVIGAPMVLLASPAHAATQTITAVSATPTSVVYGEAVIATATVTADGSGDPVGAGTIQFMVRHTPEQMEFSASGDPVHLNAAGVAVSAPLVGPDGRPLDLTQGVSDSWQVYADFTPDDPVAYDPSFGTASNDVSVSQAASSMAVLSTATTLVADMSGVLPGGTQANSIKPSGTVDFTVGGAPVGSAPIAENGRATLNVAVPTGAPRLIAASYSGDDRYTGSTDARTRLDPEISARVLSKFPQSKSGWYRTPVDVLFVCRPHDSELAADCPLQVTLKKSDENQSVNRTIQAVDGGAATVVVDDIDIDRDKPEVSIVNGKCRATDSLSGVKTCKLRSLGGGKVIAIAIDKAGNRAVARGVLD